jgi:hypothetical protein
MDYSETERPVERKVRTAYGDARVIFFGKDTAIVTNQELDTVWEVNGVAYNVRVQVALRDDRQWKAVDANIRRYESGPDGKNDPTWNARGKALAAAAEAVRSLVERDPTALLEAEAVYRRNEARRAEYAYRKANDEAIAARKAWGDAEEVARLAEIEVCRVA